MIVDASALVAVLRDEVEAASIVRALLAADACRVSAATYLEAAIVVDGSRDPVLSRRFDDLLAAIPIAIEPVTEAQARIARHAYRDFGRGAGHPARLNYGDCFSYALAKDRDEPLLFTGRDFRETDVRAALS